MLSKQSEKQAAQDLFFQTDMLQTEIAAQVGVGERTLSRWINEGQWKKIKNAARIMPAQIVDNFQEQLIEIQENIKSRPKGQRYATPEEAATMSRLVLCIARMKVEVTQSRSIQVMMNYLDKVNSHDHDLAVQATREAMEFLQGKSKQGFLPSDLEYDTGLEEETTQAPIFIPPSEKWANETHIPSFYPQLQSTTSITSFCNNITPPLGEQEGANSPIPANTSNHTKPNTAKDLNANAPIKPANKNTDTKPANSDTKRKQINDVLNSMRRDYEKEKRRNSRY